MGGSVSTHHGGGGRGARSVSLGWLLQAAQSNPSQYASSKASCDDLDRATHRAKACSHPSPPP